MAMVRICDCCGDALEGEYVQVVREVTPMNGSEREPSLDILRYEAEMCIGCERDDRDSIEQWRLL